MGSNLMSSLVLAPIGLKEVELSEYLQKDLGVDVWNPRQMTRADIPWQLELKNDGKTHIPIRLDFWKIMKKDGFLISMILHVSCIYASKMRFFVEPSEVNQYGRSGAKTLKEFSEQLIKGEVHIVKGK